jgi:glucose/arabinose dehydrogenase
LLLLAVAAQAQAPRMPACDPNNAGLQLAEGFCAVLVADGLGAVRHFVVAPNGDIFAARRQLRGDSTSYGVIALRDANGDGKADVRERFDTNRGTGITLVGEYLYFAPDNAVLRYRLPAGQLRPSAGPDTIVMDLPTGGHGAKSIAVARDGALYVNIGSRSNVCEAGQSAGGAASSDPCPELESRAGIWRFDANRLRQRQSNGTRVATGIRNAVAIRLHPQTGVLYAMQHGRDRLFENWPALYDATAGSENPSEEFIEVKQGDDFGWPYCYHDRFLGRMVLAPEYGGDAKKSDRCETKKQPLAAYPGHWAPDDLLFYNATQFPARYRGGAFIAFHGSWNRATGQQGFKIVFQPFANGKAEGEHTDFADGFRALQPGGRPMGLALGPDGSLYIGDDTGGRIWRVMYRGGPD